MLAIYAIISALSLSTASMARVVGMTGPSMASTGETVTVSLQTASYVQNWDDFGVVWGLKNQGNTCGTCVGEEIAYNNLFGEIPTGRGSKDFQITIPEYFPVGDHTLVAAVPYLVGASGSTGIAYFNQTVTIVSK